MRIVISYLPALVVVVWGALRAAESQGVVLVALLAAALVGAVAAHVVCEVRNTRRRP